MTFGNRELTEAEDESVASPVERLFGEETCSANRLSSVSPDSLAFAAKRKDGSANERGKRAEELADEAALGLRAPRRFWREDGSVGLGATSPLAISLLTNDTAEIANAERSSQSQLLSPESRLLYPLGC